MSTDTSSVPGPSRHQREEVGVEAPGRGATPPASAVDGGGVAPRLRDGEGDGGSGGGDLAAVAPAPGGAPTTAERIAATEQLIARLADDLAAARGAGEAAGETRARVALAAAEGDPAARAELEAATVAATRAVLGAENVGLALDAARARLAALEEERRAEEREALRRKNVGFCRERVALAGRIDGLLAEMAPLVEAWSRLGLTLYGASVMNREPGVVGPGQGFLGTAAFAHALPAPVAEAVGKRFFAPDHEPLAEGDPAAMTVRHADGVPEPAGRRYPSAEEMLLGYSAPPAEPAAEVEVAAEADAEPEVAPTQALLGGMRLVGRMPGGGGVWEVARQGDDVEPPAEAA